MKYNQIVSFYFCLFNNNNNNMRENKVSSFPIFTLENVCCFIFSSLFDRPNISIFFTYY